MTKRDRDSSSPPPPNQRPRRSTSGPNDLDRDRREPLQEQLYHQQNVNQSRSFHDYSQPPRFHVNQQRWVIAKKLYVKDYTY